MSEEFSRYRAIVTDLALRAFDAPQSGMTLEARDAHGRAIDSIALGIAPARLLMQNEPMLYDALAKGFRRLAQIGRQAVPGGTEGIAGIYGEVTQLPELADALGHHRTIYHPLVLHLHLAAFAKHYESLPTAVWGVCEQAVPAAVLPTRIVEQFAGTTIPHEELGLVLWHTLCMVEQAMLFSRDVDIELAEAVVHRVIADAGPAGELREREESQSFDTWTYNELSGLHALANMALLRRNKAWARRVEEVALYHVQNTQPDFTTSQPWGVFAFVWSEKCRSFAEQQIHDAQMHWRTNADLSGSASSEAPVSLVAALLMADAAHSLSKF